MGKITVELNVPDDVLRSIDLNRIRRMVEREIEIEYVTKKLHGKFQSMDLRKLLKEVEEEWTV
ncbi:hypothetical protein [Thermococcus henrietii]|uniref:hypothetical protein n=1 Tax=Thermococcus henrietii TaxID=2016361 RepID=UPI000C07DF83|nr:hypothetical protein [Thermococcus henrietii]